MADMNPRTLRNPKGASPKQETWLYEEDGGISIYFSTGGAGQRLGVIPWRFIRAALKRKDQT